MPDRLSSDGLVDKLKPFARDLVSLTTRFEEAVIQISVGVPVIEEHLDDNLLEARELTKFIFSEGDESETYGIRHDFSRFSDQLLRSTGLVRQLGLTDKDLFHRMRVSVGDAMESITRVREVLSFSEELKVFAINSIVHSHNIGNEGKGYQIISNEFIKMSGTIAQKSRDISNLSLRLDELINGRLIELMEEQENLSEVEFKKIAGESDELIDSAYKSVENFSVVLRDLLNRIETIKVPMGKIMVDLQKQDIIHQQLAHLGESIEDIVVILRDHPLNTSHLVSDEEDVREEQRSLLILLNFLLVNTDKQLVRINGEINSLTSDLESHFQMMTQRIADIVQDKKNIADLLNEERKDKNIVELIFNAPKKMVGDLRFNLSNLLEKKRSIINVFSQMVEIIEEENEHARQFLPVIDTTENLLLLARIEKARYSLNISDLDEEGGSGFSRKSLVVLEEIVHGVEDVFAMVTGYLKECEISLDGQKGLFEENGRSLEEAMTYVTQTETLFLDNYATIIDISDQLFKELNQYMNLFKSLKELKGQLDEKEAVSSRLREEVGDIVARHNIGSDLEKCRFRDIILQKIVDKCTVEQERSTLMAEFTDLEIEESSGSGVTLF